MTLQKSFIIKSLSSSPSILATYSLVPESSPALQPDSWSWSCRHSVSLFARFRLAARKLGVLLGMVFFVALAGCATTEEDEAQAAEAAAARQAQRQAKQEARQAKQEEKREARAQKQAENQESKEQKKEAKAKANEKQDITGTPAPNSKFKNLRLGMSQMVVRNHAGYPDDHRYYRTGKAWAPYYRGCDTSRTEDYYKGSGILVFGGCGNDTLIQIHHNKNEDGDRSTKN